uniref:Uncharacterized protein n=1 Tax=Myotis myotis TaxID=51298 RepID=A0A7J7YDF6_MYOMY|nr:hypothetical protein mMyoMyo1_010954 [Myotis myotis]
MHPHPFLPPVFPFPAPPPQSIREQEMQDKDIIANIFTVKNRSICPSQFGSVDRASACRLKGLGLILVKGTYCSCRLDPCARDNRLMCLSHTDVSLFLSLPLLSTLKINGKNPQVRINKIKFKKKKKTAI